MTADLAMTSRSRDEIYVEPLMHCWPGNLYPQSKNLVSAAILNGLQVTSQIILVRKDKQIRPEVLTLVGTTWHAVPLRWHQV